MKKIILFTVMCCSLLLTICSIREKEQYNICFKDECVEISFKKKKHNNIYLENVVDSYVLNRLSFEHLSEKNAMEYLQKGGIIIVNDQSVTQELIEEKLDVINVKHDFENFKHCYGFYIVNVGEGNLLVNVTLAYANSTGKYDAVVFGEKEKVEIAQDITKNAISTAAIDPNFSYDDGMSNPGEGIGGPNQSPSTEIVTFTTGQQIAFGIIETFVYNEKGNKKLGSYKIYTEVYDTAKYKDTSNIIHGIYDVYTKFTVDPDPDYAIYDYTVQMRSNSTILDESYLYSDATTTVSMDSGVTFAGNVVQGGFNASKSYTYNGGTQEIVNNLPAGKIKEWIVEPIEQIKNNSRKIEPSIRIVNEKDGSNNYVYSSFNKITFYEYKFIGYKLYKISEDYLPELGVIWNAYGLK